MPARILIYGATGYTGTLIARHAKDRGLCPILAARHPAKLKSLAESLGFAYRVVQLEDANRLAEAADRSGNRVRARLVTPDAYTFTGVTAIAVAERVLNGHLESGFQTPARVYGPDFVLSCDGAFREDLDAHRPSTAPLP